MLYTILYKILAAVQATMAKILGFDAMFKELGDRLEALRRSHLALLEAVHLGFEEHTDLLKRILTAVEPLPAVGFVFTVYLEGQTLEGVTTLQLKDNQKCTASITPVTAKGNPAQVQEGSVVWTGQEFLTITQSGDGLSVEVVANGPLGSGQINVTADADLGEGVVPITGQLHVEVIAGQAVAVTINTSEPVDQ